MRSMLKKPGDIVNPGEALVHLEICKMDHWGVYDGDVPVRLKRIVRPPGEKVSPGDLLVELEAIEVVDAEAA